MDTIAVAGLIVATLGAIAAVFAALYAKNSPTRDDLARVERNTAETTEQLTFVREHVARVEDHLGIQNRREALAAAADRISIAVKGEGWLGKTIPLSFVLTDPGTSLVRIDLINDVGSLSGSTQCESSEPCIFNAVINSDEFSRWVRTGKTLQTSEHYALYIRAVLLLNESEVERRFPVTVFMGLRSSGPSVMSHFLEVSGKC